MRLRTSDLEKRYQVFISSTFQDLQGARQEVSQALLRADCFPAGMELFPAADAEQFEFIKTVIDQSDYYILISAGRYGSIQPETGLSYTEMEYDYAVETGKPVIRLLHKEARQLADESDAQVSKLMAFREKLKTGKMVAFWETPDQLGMEVAYALLDIKKRKPAIGWAKANEISSKDSRLKIAELTEENRLINAALAHQEAREFGPILTGLSGEISFKKYKYLDVDESMAWLENHPPNIEITSRLQKFIYQPTEEIIPIPASDVMRCLCFAFLFSDEFSSAAQIAFASETELGCTDSQLLIPESLKELEPLFMALEGTGIILPGERFGRSLISLLQESSYLSGTRWVLSEEFRRWVVRQGKPEKLI